MYERARKPRAPIPKGTRIQRPLSAIFNQARCSICLEWIRNCKVIMECPARSRYCGECIDRSLALGNNSCPCCRVHIASKRSLKDDPAFNRLVESLVGQQGLETTNNLELQVGETPTKSLQMAIHQQAARSCRRIHPVKREDKEAPKDSLMVPPLVVLHLVRHTSSKLSSDLALPYLRVSGAAKLRVIQDYLKAKLGSFVDLYSNVVRDDAKLIRVVQNGRLATMADFCHQGTVDNPLLLVYRERS